MALTMTLNGVDGPKKTGQCKCVYNPRTKKSVQLCFVGKNSKNRSGWQFQKGGSQRCSR